MELSARDLAFLEHELKQIKEDRDRDGEDRQQAASLLGRIEGEIERQEQVQANGVMSVKVGGERI